MKGDSYLKEKRSVTITSIVHLADDIISLWVKDEQAAQEAKAGCFVSLYTKDQSRLLPRPISICEIDKDAGLLRLVFRVVGFGTNEFAHYSVGDTIDMIGPLGNGFPLEGKTAILIGGGIGIPPMLQLAKDLHAKGVTCEIVLGYRDTLFLKEEFSPYGRVTVATEDGSTGIKGNVIDAITENEIAGDIIYSCGPLPMLRGVKEYASIHNQVAWLSLEEKMACGIGACLACITNVNEIDHHSMVKNKRICKDGPVFLATEVDFS